ncbi:ammonium transporter [Lachnospiraceae bacterium ZAX-1]
MEQIFSSVDTIWVLLGAALVFFMQAGFAMVEGGFTRAKNSGNIIMKNLLDFCLGTVVFWAVGFGLMFGASNAGIIGTPDFFIKGDYAASLGLTFPTLVFVIFQTVFCATAATIVSGAMAERTKFISYIIYSAVISAVIYPVSGHWIWGGGWLAELGFHDFAGSTAVHMVGGVAALVGAKVLGPRIGKYSKSGKSRAIPGHNLTIGALGVFILWFAWFGFNGCSTVSMTGDDTLALAGQIFTSTNMSAVVATITVMIITWIRYKKPDVSMTLNGSLAGLVAITAGCDQITMTGAFFVGLIAGFVVFFGIEFIDKVLKIDDPVGAIGVHGLCGAAGTILTGFFSTSDGLLYGHGFKFLGVQILGVIVVAIWVGVTMTILFNIIKNTIGLRVSKDEEIIGLDIEEHGLQSSYADFMIGDGLSSRPAMLTSTPASVQQVETSVPPVVSTKAPGQPNLFNVVIITRQNKLDELVQALGEIGVTGVTITNVLGCGLQKGSLHYYRGAELDLQLLPKVQVEVAVSKVPVALVVSTAEAILQTGNIGDGKVFVYDLQNIIKIRTGEQGYDALQDIGDE